MAQYTKDRDIKLALTSIKNVIESIKQMDGVQSQAKLQKKGSLEMMLRKMRVSKLSQVFVQKLSQSNTLNEPAYHHLQSQKEINQNRWIKVKGISLNSQIISVIYLLDIIFCFVTFVTGSFRSFIANFKNSGDGDSGVFIGLMIAAIVVTSLKIMVNCVMVKIDEGIFLEYIVDIWLSFIQNWTIFIDMAYVAINIALLALHNDSGPLSFLLFIISIIKLFSLYQNLRTFQITFINSPKKQQYFNLLKVALFNIFFAHFVASMLLAMSLINSQENWMVVKGIDQEEWYIQYIWAFYWGCTIIMTVGFGDFSAFFFRQAIILAFIELFSCIVLAFNISEIGGIIMNIRASQTEFRRKIAIFKRMAKQNKIDPELQRRIEGFLREETNIKETFEFKERNELLAEIPENLRSEFITEANKLLFPDLPFFKNLQKSTLIGFTQKFTGKVYYPGEYVMKLDQGNDTIKILKNGKVGLAYKKYGSSLNGTIVQSVKVVDREVLTHQGEFVERTVPILLNNDFLSQTKKINYDIIAQKYSFVYEITQENFFQVIKSSEIDSSYFFSIRHKHTIIKNEWEQLACEHCSKPEDQDHHSGQNIINQHDQKDHNSFLRHKNLSKLPKTKYHTKFQCPKLHYFPLNGVSILRNILSHDGRQQSRNEEMERKRFRNGNCLANRKAFFKLYQESRNLGGKKRHQTEREERKKYSWRLLERENKKVMSAEDLKRQEEQTEQIQAIERIVRDSIAQVLTGYKAQFWELQIDKLYNYVNYFPLQNPKNLDFIHLSKGKNHSFFSAGVLMSKSGTLQR